MIERFEQREWRKNNWKERNGETKRRTIRYTKKRMIIVVLTRNFLPFFVNLRLDQGSNSSLYNLDFALGTTQPSNQSSFTNNQDELVNFRKTKSISDNPLKILQKLDATKMSSTVIQGAQTELSPRAKEVIGKFDDLSFMHSSVLMFPLNKTD